MAAAAGYSAQGPGRGMGTTCLEIVKRMILREEGGSGNLRNAVGGVGGGRAAMRTRGARGDLG